MIMTANRYEVLNTDTGIVQLQCTQFNQQEVLPGGIVCNEVNQKIWITTTEMEKLQAQK